MITPAHERATATAIIHTAFPYDTSKLKLGKVFSLSLATTTSAISIASRRLHKQAVIMVRMRENIEKTWEARNREVMKDAVANPAAIGWRMRTTRSPSSTTWIID